MILKCIGEQRAQTAKHSGIQTTRPAGLTELKRKLKQGNPDQLHSKASQNTPPPKKKTPKS